MQSSALTIYLIPTSSAQLYFKSNETVYMTKVREVVLSKFNLLHSYLQMITVLNFKI